MAIALHGDDDTNDEYRHITPADFAALDHDTVTLLDLREPDEVIVHPVKDAINIPFDQIGQRLGSVPTGKPVVVFCRVGDWSEQVCEILADRGYEAINLDGGFAALRDAGYADGVAAGDTAAGTSDNVTDDTATQVVTSGDSKEETIPAAQAAPKTLHVDAKGLKCPGPIVAVADALRPEPAGTRLTVEATEDAFCSDIAVWAERTGNTLLSLTCESDDGIIHAELEKGAPAGTTPNAAPQSLSTAGSAAAPASAGGDVLHDKTFVVFSGDLDKTIAVFIMANGAAAMGRKVTIFFTFWGLNILRKPKHVRVAKNLVERMFGFMMPRGTKQLGLSRMNMGGLGATMIRWIMRSKNVASLEELMKQATDHGVRLVACQMSMDIMGIRKEELIDGVELGGVSTFLGAGETSDMSLFV
ncbi:pyridine nucleotide-disulfide oxidoreductase [Bifidobacterium ramosum]|uniref:Pyridine nucleotide-disulfide oxidoreductase n=1 Tax=Bifidobacterium ramosum TaxID=1798158 RepID=A0A6L4X288_9BIFI|nr:DsrE/DsrF/DrsH-like family protein [Bifidobacterium ramosum]KAB8288990.1 pyridine nucleotide-disulfide oxidoreductase [Bifidobacterium ramosum]NEG70705.1 pyridine nucleotide-disulfide oxidoreductase [Bifidobacterium ramosum]